MSAENPTLLLKRKYILGLGNWLSRLSLFGRESRERTKFIETLAEQMKENDAVRIEILKKYADKDESGEPVVVNEEKGAHYSVSDDKMPEFAAEMNAYLDEDFVVEGEGNRQRLKVLKDVIINTDTKIAPEVAAEYDKWCEAFEKVEI